MSRKGPGVTPPHLNPLAIFNPLKPKNQVAILAAMFVGPGGRVAASGIRAGATRIVASDAPKKLLFHGYKHGVSAAYAYFALEPVLPAYRGDKKIGFRLGSKGVVPMSSFFWGPTGMYRLPYMHKVPVPTFGFGFTAVPHDEPFFGVGSKSRGGEHTTSSRTPETATKTIVGPLAKNRQADRRPSSITPGAPGTGVGRKTAGGTKKARGRRAPYCWRHKKRHFCKFTK